MDDVRKPEPQDQTNLKPDLATWRRENLAKIQAWNEWDERTPLLPDEPPSP